MNDFDRREEIEANDARMHQDLHFYIDNAPPKEVTQVLGVLSVQTPMTSQEIADFLANEHDFMMQKDHNYSPRRLLDLGLVAKVRKEGKAAYTLSAQGEKVGHLLNSDPALGMDILHYLHLTGHKGAAEDRKYLWSYRRCCQLIWAAGYAIPPSELATIIQGEISTFWGLDMNVREGVRFNSTAASALYTWLRALDPSPISRVREQLSPRVLQRFELVLLALDHVYRTRGYHYGDPVLMDTDLIDQVSAVFFLERESCASLLRVAASISSKIKLVDTMAGVSIKLLQPVTVESV